VNNTIQLPNGRTLAYAEYGKPRGKPVFFFHGIPGSRYFRPPDEITEKMGVRLICVDRPGYGRSDFQPGRRILDWPDDITQLADALDIKNFTVAGHSGGGPYVAACAYKLTNRITTAAILCGIRPLDTPEAVQGIWGMNRIGFQVGRWMPWLLWRAAIWLFFHKGHDDPETVMERDAKYRPPADEVLFSQPEIRTVCYQSTREGFRQGTRGHAWEARLVCRPWGFRLEDIHVPVYLWHGEDDNMTPITMGRYVAGKIPNCRATFCKGEAHLLIFPHWEEILRTLI
jgi:pimeloyl-ACP methyl ester carboxylesterase